MIDGRGVSDVLSAVGRGDVVSVGGCRPVAPAEGRKEKGSHQNRNLQHDVESGGKEGRPGTKECREALSSRESMITQ